MDPETKRLHAASYCSETQIEQPQAPDEWSRVAQLLVRVARAQPHVAVVALGLGSRLRALSAEFHERYYEFHEKTRTVITWSARLAAAGARPLVCLPAGSLTERHRAVVESVGLASQPITFVVGSGGTTASRRDRSSPFLFAYLRIVPNLAVLAPRNDREFASMLRWSLHKKTPTALCLPVGGLHASHHGNGAAATRLPRAEVLRSGDDVALIAVGGAVGPAAKAAELLARRGVEATLVSARAVRPLDADTIVRCALGASCVVTIEEGAPAGGFGSAVLELLAEHGIAVHCSLLGLQAPRSGIDAQDQQWKTGRIVRRVRQALEGVIDQNVASRRSVSTNAQRSDAREIVRQDLASFPPAGSLAEQRTILQVQCSPAAQRWIAAYANIGDRTDYLWKWCIHGLELTTLPCVLPELRADVCDTKFLTVMLGVLLDDVADRQGDTDFLEALLAIVSGTGRPDLTAFSGHQRAYADFTAALREELHQRIEDYPCFDVFKDLLRYDILQVWNTMRYAHLVNRHLFLINLVEHDLYLTHNMQMMSSATLDLMCSPGFDCTELGRLREVVWRAQCMARIGNLVSTWQREIGDRDYTSGVFARALMRGELTADQLAGGDRREIATAIRRGRHEEYFLRQWRHQRRRLRAMRGMIRSFDVGELIEGLERLVGMELASRGHK